MIDILTHPIQYPFEAGVGYFIIGEIAFIIWGMMRYRKSKDNLPIQRIDMDSIGEDDENTNQLRGE